MVQVNGLQPTLFWLRKKTKVVACLDDWKLVKTYNLKLKVKSKSKLSNQLAQATTWMLQTIQQMTNNQTRTIQIQQMRVSLDKSHTYIRIWSLQVLSQRPPLNTEVDQHAMINTPATLNLQYPTGLIPVVGADWSHIPLPVASSSLQQITSRLIPHQIFANDQALNPSRHIYLQPNASAAINTASLYLYWITSLGEAA